MGRTKTRRGQAVMGQGRQAVPSTAQVPLVPFDEAAHIITTEGPKWVVTPGATVTKLEPKPLLADGFLKRVVFEVKTIKEGVEGAGPEGSEDYPFNIIERLFFRDNGGHPIFELSGFNAFLSNVFGGYAGSPDPRNDPDFSKSLKAPNIALYIPIEIAPTGFGALANMSQSAPYLVGAEIAPKSEIWKKLETAPELEITAWQESWDFPEPTDQAGTGQVQYPPFEGTTQFWTEQANVKLSAGENQTFFTRMGNMIRTHILIARESGKRSEEVIPNPFRLQWDRVELMQCSASLQRKRMQEAIDHLVERPTGVYAFMYSLGEGRFSGGNQTNLWLPTVNATRFELKGSSKKAGELTIVTNDVSVSQMQAALKAQRPGVAAYHPVTGEALSGTL